MTTILIQVYRISRVHLSDLKFLITIIIMSQMDLTGTIARFIIIRVSNLVRSLQNHVDTIMETRVIHAWGISFQNVIRVLITKTIRVSMPTTLLVLVVIQTVCLLKGAHGITRNIIISTNIAIKKNHHDRAHNLTHHHRCKLRMYIMITMGSM